MLGNKELLETCVSENFQDVGTKWRIVGSSGQLYVILRKYVVICTIKLYGKCR